MLNNKADTIEKYILSRLEGNQDKQIELKRTAVADEISCAPSQVSYVLSTRFTAERGFSVESRRGLGGYIRIAVVTEEVDRKQLLFREMIEDIDEFTPFAKIKTMLDYLLRLRIVTRREAELVAQMSANLYKSESLKKVSAEERAKLIRSTFATLAKIT